MFDLDDAVSDWRRQIAADGISSDEIFDELESHLRDDVEERRLSGLTAEQAFKAAVVALGEAAALQGEFAKVAATHPVYFRKAREAVLTLAGIPTHYQANNMNTQLTSNVEPRWATYLKAAIFMLPALALWSFSAVFLLPKVQQICQQAGLPLSGGEHLLANVMQTGLHLLQHGVMIAAAVILALLLLEWRSEKWPRYRRATVGAGVFLLNSSILILITVTLMLALLAAPALFNR